MKPGIGQTLRIETDGRVLTLMAWPAQREGHVTVEAKFETPGCSVPLRTFVHVPEADLAAHGDQSAWLHALAAIAMEGEALTGMAKDAMRGALVVSGVSLAKDTPSGQC